MEETKHLKEQVVPGYPEYRPPKPEEKFPVLPGIYLVEPHGKLIAERKKTAIVKSKEFKKYIGKDIYVCGDFVYAVIKLNQPYKINLEQFKKLRDKHRISDEERKRWWPDKKSLYLYSFRIVKIFKKPLKYDRVLSIQVFISEVKPYRKNLKYLEVGPQHISEKDKVIKLSEVTSVIKTFVVKNPFLFLTGGIVNREKTKGDFDILYRAEYLPNRMLQEIKEGLMNGLDDNLRSRSHLMMDTYHGPFTSNIPLGKLQVTKVEEKVEEKSYIPVGSSGVEIGEDICLNGILEGLSSFVFEEKFLWLVGELPARGETKKYIDFVFRYPKLPLSISVALKFRIWRALPKEYWHRIRYKFDQNFKPADTDICFGKLEFILNERLDIVEMSLKNLISKQRAASPEIRAQAKASAKEDKVKLFRFYLPLKPIRGYFPRERQTIDLFVSIVTDESKGPWHSTKKYDGLNCIIFYDKGKAQIFSEDGEDNTDRFPELIKELKDLGADNFSFVAEIELWKIVDGELKHQPREAVIGRVHRKGVPDETGLVANVYDITYLNGKDIHNEPFEKRLEALKTLKFPQATWGKPNLKYKLNRAPAILSKTAEDIRKHTQFLRKLDGSEGNVIKLSSAKYRLDGKRSNQWKFHNSGVMNVIVIEAIETKVKNVWNYLFGLDPQDKKVPEKLVVEIGGKKYLKVGKTFSSARPMKKGDVFILEYETLNLERNEKTDEIKVTAWSPRELGKTDKKVDTIDNAVRKAKAGLVFQEKIIPVEGETIYKGDLITDLEKQVLLYKEVPPEDKGPYKYVCHHHWRGKSLRRDEPILLKLDKKVFLAPIGSLFPEHYDDDTIQPKEDLKIWTRNGWETLKRIFRHRKEDSKMLRLNTYAGSLDITDDHSVFINGQPVQASVLEKGSIVDLCELPILKGELNPPEDFAWVAGFFVAEGYLHGNDAVFCNSDKKLLEKVQEFAEIRGFSYYYEDKNRKLGIRSLDIFKDSYIPVRCQLRHKKGAYHKRVPDIVFSWNLDKKKKFLDGFLAGDGLHFKKQHRFTQYSFASASKNLAQGLILLIKAVEPDVDFRIGFQESIIDGYKGFCYTINAVDFTHEFTRRTKPKRGTVKSCERLTFFNPEIYVYDVETETHSFLAGIGRILAHNSCHTDLRIIAKRGEYAIGWTIDDLIKGAIKEPVTTMKEARRIEKEGKAFKIDWKTGKFAMRRTAAGQIKPTELRAHEKARIPVEWLEVQGVAPVGTVGATKEYPGVFIIIDKGEAQYLTQKTYYHEYWMDGTLKGRLVFRRLEQKTFKDLVERGILPKYILNSFNASLAYVNKELNPVEDKYIPLVKDGSIVFKESELKKIILPPSEVPEGKPRIGVFWVAIQPIVQVPYVISRRAVNKKWVPPKGFSALTLDLKKKVPSEFKYWTKEKKSERRKIRDAYFEYLKKQPKKEKFETECPKVRVTERVIKEEVWICPYCKKEIGEKELYHNQKTNKWYHRPCFEKGPIEFPKDDRVLCQNCLKVVDYVNEPEVCMGAIKCPHCGAIIDQTGKVLVENKGKKVGTFPFALHWHWWRGPIVVRRGPSAQHWDVRIDNGEMPFPHFQCTENPVVIDKTTCVYKPCKVREALKWDGSIAPAGVTKELVEVTVIEKVDETAEGQIYTVEDKKGETHTSKPVRYPRLKKDDKVWMDHLERLWTIVNPDANPTKNTPAYIVLIDDGKAEVLEDSDLFKKVRFRGKKLKGLYTFVREDPKTDIWVMAKSGLPGEEK